MKNSEHNYQTINKKALRIEIEKLELELKQQEKRKIKNQQKNIIYLTLSRNNNNLRYKYIFNYHLKLLTYPKTNSIRYGGLINKKNREKLQICLLYD